MRIAINIGGGFVPGLDTVVAGAALAAIGSGWEAVGIRDGYDGLLAPERYPDGALVELDARTAEALAAGDGCRLGTAARTDPFRVRAVSSGHDIDETDRSEQLLSAVHEARIDAVVSIVGGSAVTGQHALSVAFKLCRKGLPTVCVPKAVENEIASVPLAFGYNSVLSHTTETLRRARAAAQDAGRLLVVEVPGHVAGWLALQAGIASLADAVLIPEISYDVRKVAAAIAANDRAGRRPALVVVAEGARPSATSAFAGSAPPGAGALRASLAPNADPDFGEGRHVIDRSGAVARAVGAELQRLLDRETLPLALGPLVRGGAPTAVDRQLGLAYGAAAVRALRGGATNVLVSFRPPDVDLVPMTEALNTVRTVPANSEFVQVARALGMALGD